MATYGVGQRYHGSGLVMQGISGEPLTRGAAIYMSAVDGLWYLADSDALVTMPAVGVSTEQVTTGLIFQILLVGIIGRRGWTWTRGDMLYVSGVAGVLTQVAPGLAQPIAIALTATDIYVNPDWTVPTAAACPILEGHTVYVGFDVCKGLAHTNYWTCDGVADDVQIALAITYTLGLGGGTIFLEEGTYDITATITFAGGDLQIIGDGREATILSLGFNGNLMQIVTQNDFTIRDLSMVGNKATYATDFWSGGLFQTVDNLLVENCDFYDFAGKGVFARAVTDSIFSNCRFYSNTQDGLFLEDMGLGVLSQKVNVNACFAYSNARKGFNCGEIKDVKFVGCMAYSNTEDGWNLEGSADDSYTLQNVDLIGCNAYSNGWAGFKVQQICSNVIIDGCDAYDNNNGIWLRGNDTYLMKNIIVSDSSFYLNESSGINISYGIEWLKVISVSAFNNDQSATNNDGISLGFSTHMQHMIFDDIHAYDDQLVATQDRGIDFGAVDFDGKDVTVRRLRGTGNTSELIRETNVDIPFLFVPISDPNATLGDHPVVDMPENTDTNVYAQIYVPLEFQELESCDVIVVSAATGNMVWTVDTDFGKICSAEDYNTHPDSGGATTALTINDLECVSISAALSLIAAGDLIGVNFMRDGDDGSDDIEDSVYYLGIRFRYV